MYPRRKRRKIALITGASSGIGREFVRQIGKAYPSIEEIWVIARREKALRELQREAFGSKLRLLPLDLCSLESLSQLERLLKRERPCIRILVNSAGMGKDGFVEEQDWRELGSMIDLNCRALTAVTAICLPYLKRGSRILQMDSGAAFLPQPGFAVYAATKAYVLSFDQALARELKSKGITLTSVCPGPVDTPFFQAGGISPSPLKRRFFVKSEKVVRKALLDAARGRSLSLCSPSIRLVQLAGKLLPQRILLGMAELMGGKRMLR